MSSASAAKSAERIEGAILSTAFHCNTGSALRGLVGCAARRSGQPLAGRRGNELRAAEADSGEAVGAVAVREAAERAGRVERDRRVDRRIEAEGRLRRGKVACGGVVFLGL